MVWRTAVMVTAAFIAANGTIANAQAAPGAAVPATGQTALPPQAVLQDIAGIWQATLMPPNAQHGIRFVIKIAKSSDGTYKGALYNADQGQPPLTFNTVTFQGTDVKLANSVLTVAGKLSPDGKTIDGTFNGFGPNPLPVSLARTNPDDAWAIPEPIKPMAADAKPEFDVVTVKPSPPGQPGKGFGMNGTHFVTRNTNLNDLIAFAYGMHFKQLVGAPDWFDKDLFDIDGVPNVEGRPNLKQMGMMVQKMLADRCQFKFHMEQRELSVYIITVAPGGPKMTKSTAAPSDPQGFGFRALGDLTVRNMSMKDFAAWMQNGVMDRPVVDHTGLTDRYDFALKWTADDSQFAQFRSVGATPPAAGDNPNAPPALYTAMPEQIGLKIEAGKAMDDVLVIDHIEKPSAN